MKSLLPVLLVAVGGAVGALARYALTPINLHLPAGTLLVNVVGCFLMGLLMFRLEAGIASPEVRLAVGVGFLGALTTFSTFSAELLKYLHTRNYLAALVYTSISLVGSVAAMVLGHRLAAGWR
jgi:CrcB protein